ncbi:hypothetical protein Mapa_006279 [Marchantia paleacea]|nr:hypothetical protein Mapa_006279 [Marchantia paleacea]
MQMIRQFLTWHDDRTVTPTPRNMIHALIETIATMASKTMPIDNCMQEASRSGRRALWAGTSTRQNPKT